MQTNLFDVGLPFNITNKTDERDSCRVIPEKTNKQDFGQFFTPSAVAKLMGTMVFAQAKGQVKVLDPGSGEGVLSKALVEELAGVGSVESIHIDAFEIDGHFAAKTEETLSSLAKKFGKRPRITYLVRNTDFLKTMWHRGRNLENKYDFVIMNPPYYKLRKDSPEAKLAGRLVYGQPNIYGLFIALGAKLLKDGGRMVAITPRSWLSGSYFSQIRIDVLSMADLEKVHAFHARGDVFNGDKVLQETVIFQISRNGEPKRPDVHISVSTGISDLSEGISFSIPWKTLCPKGIGNGIRIPESIHQVGALREMELHRQLLGDFGLTVSTGPVVAFRAAKFLKNGRSGSGNEAPLIRINHVKPGMLDWPGKKNGTPQFLECCPESRKLLLEGGNMLLVRRFSAKEDLHRVIACYVPKGSMGRLVGVENHLNIIRGFRGENGQKLALAMANYLNSDMVDQYMRATSGTTQVNAAELRGLPFPDGKILLSKHV